MSIRRLPKARAARSDEAVPHGAAGARGPRKSLRRRRRPTDARAEGAMTRRPACRPVSARLHLPARGLEHFGNYAGACLYANPACWSLAAPVVVPSSSRWRVDRRRNHDAFRGARVCCVLCAHGDPVPLAVRRSQSVAAFLKACKIAAFAAGRGLVDRPLPGAVKNCYFAS